MTGPDRGTLSVTLKKTHTKHSFCVNFVSVTLTATLTSSMKNHFSSTDAKY